MSDTYVRITGYIIQQININWCRKSIQHFMLADSDFNNISIDTYKREIFPTFMLADGEYIIRSLNRLYVEVIDNIQC